MQTSNAGFMVDKGPVTLNPPKSTPEAIILLELYSAISWRHQGYHSFTVFFESLAISAHGLLWMSLSLSKEI